MSGNTYGNTWKYMAICSKRVFKSSTHNEKHHDPFQKRMTKQIFPESHLFWKMFPGSKQDIRKPWDLHSVLYK